MKRTLGMLAGAIAVVVTTACGHVTPITAGSPPPATPFPIAVTAEYATIASNAQPAGVTKGSDGSLWFTEYGAGNIGKLSTSATITEYPLQNATVKPLSITLGPDNNLWFTEFGQPLIGSITTSGAPYTTYALGNPLATPWGITTGPDGALWVTDPGTNSVWRVTTAGAATQYPLPSAGANPTSITAGPNGGVWFTESALDRIAEILPGSTPGPSAVSEYAVAAGAGLGTIVTGPDGALWFTETTADKLGRMLPSGQLASETTLTGMTAPYGIIAGVDGNFYIGDKTASLIAQYVTSTQKLSTHATITPNAGVDFLGLGPDNEVYFSENAVNKIGQFRYF